VFRSWGQHTTRGRQPSGATPSRVGTRCPTPGGLDGRPPPGARPFSCVEVSPSAAVVHPEGSRRRSEGKRAASQIGRRVGQVLLALVLMVLLIWGLMFLRALVPRPHPAQHAATAGLEGADAVVDDLRALYEDCVDEPGPSLRGIGAETLELPQSAPLPDASGPRLVVVREVRLASSDLGCLPLPMACEPAVAAPRLPEVARG
jgi:hypothetical protein